MRQVSAVTQARLDAGELVLRSFVWIAARRRDTGALAARGWWNDVGTLEAQVIDAQDVVRTRTFIGSGDLMGLGSVPLILGMTAQEVTIQLSLMSQAVAELVREWEPRRAAVEIHRGLFDPWTKLMVEPAARRFIGFVDDPDIPTPAEGQEGTITLRCASLSQELQRSSSAKRSSADQRKRHPGDAFLDYAATIKHRKPVWGDRDSA
ncbi:hypothetical protein LX81_00286 [Palleronia aestuarii]|uniref:Uncharacterized protein n=1 Tax=Palleronia aestuarii TaxID=568105 RepID=A0A2W7NK43_9RHOB|nr:hypothetical protein [Palleronia aestuarii]PZX19823.1 hypothetical protein LX81_00286 [Palleronia aestuarii]